MNKIFEKVSWSSVFVLAVGVVGALLTGYAEDKKLDEKLERKLNERGLTTDNKNET